MRLAAAVLLLAWSLAPARAQEDPRRLAKDLASPSWKTRERATRKLQALGSAAVPALREAAASPNPEVRWRAEALLVSILPQQYYYEALALADQGKLAEAIAKVGPLVGQLRPGTRPDPAWTLGILKEIAELEPAGAGSTSRAIAWHNLHCLLREAGVASGRVLVQARSEYHRLVPGDKRACRLLAILDMEWGDVRLAKKHWELGKNGDSDEAYWGFYDLASYQASQGKIKEAVDSLARAIAKGGQAKEEARRSSDFHMLQGLPEFERLVK